MIQIEIHRPGALLCLIIVLLTFIAMASGMVSLEFNGGQQTAELQEQVRAIPNAGGPESDIAEDIMMATLEARRARQVRTVLEHKEEILRYQLSLVQAEFNQTAHDNEEKIAELHEATKRLRELLMDKKKAEEYLLAALEQLWDAQVLGGYTVTTTAREPLTTGLMWPIEPTLGISAGFHDHDYEELFGMVHEAIDIPAEQGSMIRAPANGVVEQIADNGYGYSYLILRHNGISTLYGHIESFLVSEGQTVAMGDPIAYSGGTPGTPGAGVHTTGAHLHFEVIKADGQRTDPMAYMEAHPAVMIAEEVKRGAAREIVW